MREKRYAALLFCIVFMHSMSFMNVAKENTVIPFIFDEIPVYFEGEYVNIANETRGYVYTLDGKHIETMENENEILENGYIKVEPRGEEAQWTVFTTLGQRAIEGAYDLLMVVENDIAIVGNGTWRPPGIFSGKYGAIDLKTGKVVVPLEYERLSMSADTSYLIAENGHGSEIKYYAFDLLGKEVSDLLTFVCIDEYDNAYYKVLNLKTGLVGLADKDKKLLTAMNYDELGSVVFESAVLVKKDEYWGASSIDGTDKLLQPIEYNHAISHQNKMYSLHKRSAEEEISFFYGDGGFAFSSGKYNEINVAYGDIIYLQNHQDKLLAGFSKTGQIIVGPFKDAYAFAYEQDDFVRIYRGMSDSDVSSVMIINKWGEILVPYDNGVSLSNDISEKGLSLYNLEKDATLRIMADGTHLATISTSGTTDYKRGHVIFNDGNDAYVTDLMGNILIPKGRYKALYSSERVSFNFDFKSMNAQVDDNTYVKNKPQIYGIDKQGKYGGLELPQIPYIYKAHAWAKNDIDEAIQKGLVPKDQQRDWRDTTTRADFCRLLKPLLDHFGQNSGKQVAFTDTNDPDILAVAALGIVHGTGEDKFSPNRPLTRQEAAVILARTARLLSVEPTGEVKIFDDRADFAPWAKEEITYVNGVVYANDDARVMQGASENKFLPQSYYTREQSIVTILRLYRAKRDR